MVFQAKVFINRLIVLSVLGLVFTSKLYGGELEADIQQDYTDHLKPLFEHFHRNPVYKNCISTAKFIIQ